MGDSKTFCRSFFVRPATLIIPLRAPCATLSLMPRAEIRRPDCNALPNPRGLPVSCGHPHGMMSAAMLAATSDADSFTESRAKCA